MSVQTGWFVVVNDNSKVRETVAYRCLSCSVEYFFLGDDPERVFCCGQWKDKPKEGWLSGKLPRVNAPRAGGMTVLHTPKIDFGGAEDESLHLQT
jgi:hypothetical protein